MKYYLTYITIIFLLWPNPTICENPFKMKHFYLGLSYSESYKTAKKIIEMNPRLSITLIMPKKSDIVTDKLGKKLPFYNQRTIKLYFNKDKICYKIVFEYRYKGECTESFDKTNNSSFDNFVKPFFKITDLGITTITYSHSIKLKEDTGYNNNHTNNFFWISNNKQYLLYSEAYYFF
jgi:hypothetical protein